MIALAEVSFDVLLLSVEGVFRSSEVPLAGGMFLPSRLTNNRCGEAKQVPPEKLNGLIGSLDDPSRSAHRC